VRYQRRRKTVLVIDLSAASTDLSSKNHVTMQEGNLWRWDGSILSNACSIFDHIYTYTEYPELTTIPQNIAISSFPRTTSSYFALLLLTFHEPLQKHPPKIVLKILAWSLLTLVRTAHMLPLADTPGSGTQLCSAIDL